MLAGRYLNILEQSAENKGFVDQISQYIRDNKNITSKELPKGYVWYLYNIMYPRAEITLGIKSVLEEALRLEQEPQLDEDKKDEVNSARAVAIELDASTTEDSLDSDEVNLDQVDASSSPLKPGKEEVDDEELLLSPQNKITPLFALSLVTARENAKQEVQEPKPLDRVSPGI
jgi:hypothetical protein